MIELLFGRRCKRWVQLLSVGLAQITLISIYKDGRKDLVFLILVKPGNFLLIVLAKLGRPKEESELLPVADPAFLGTFLVDLPF